jgi:hypothetical protein
MRSRLAHRSEDAIWRRAHQMGFERRQRYAKWRLVSDEELKEVQEEDSDDSQEVSTSGGRSKITSSPSAGRRGRSRSLRIFC